jgi:hypothetical protein
MALAVRQRNQGDLTQMKKFMSIMLALALTAGLATVTLAQDGKDAKSTASKKKGGKKGGGKDADTKDKGAKKGGKKGKDTDKGK